jgi:hypothetical protein
MQVVLGEAMRKIIFFDGLHNIFFVAAMIGFSLSIFSFGSHLMANFDFSVLKVDRICEMPLNNRCEDHYLVKGKDGKMETMIPSGYKFRNGELAIGNHLKKNRFELSYQVNGARVDWAYLILHTTGVLLSCIIFIWWQFLTKKLAH